VKNICGEDSEEGDDNRTDAQSYGPCRWRIAMVTYQSNSDSSIVFHRTSVIFLLHSDFPDLFAFFFVLVWMAPFLHYYTLFGSITF